MRSIMPRYLVIRLIIALIIIFGMTLPFSNGVAATEKNAKEIILIKTPGCTKCAAAERVLGTIGQQMPLNVTGYFYYSDEGHRVIKQYKAKDVPAIISWNPSD